MAEKDKRVLERGNIYFFYRPKVDRDDARGVRDIERFYVVLSPEGGKKYRLVVVGRKVLPKTGRHERNWGFVSLVTSSTNTLKKELEATSYETKTKGERHLAAARPAGEGVYAIVRHDNHTHLAYALELPDEPDRVQRDLRIGEQGSYVVTVKNPEAGSPKNAGLEREEQAAFPKRLTEVFRGRKFADLDPPDFLDHEGAELILVGASSDAEKELDVGLKPEKESESSADIFRELHLDRKEHPVEPLFEGKWE